MEYFYETEVYKAGDRIIPLFVTEIILRSPKGNMS